MFSSVESAWENGSQHATYDCQMSVTDELVKKRWGGKPMGASLRTFFWLAVWCCWSVRKVWVNAVTLWSLEFVWMWNWSDRGMRQQITREAGTSGTLKAGPASSGVLLHLSSQHSHPLTFLIFSRKVRHFLKVPSFVLWFIRTHEFVAAVFD